MPGFASLIAPPLGLLPAFLFSALAWPGVCLLARDFSPGWTCHTRKFLGQEGTCSQAELLSPLTFPISGHFPSSRALSDLSFPLPRGVMAGGLGLPEDACESPGKTPSCL